MSSDALSQVRIRRLGLQPYQISLDAMKVFTRQRNATTIDEIWLLQHPRVFTQGQVSKPEHILCSGDIPVVQSNRGGQVTYHAPGQLIAYLLLDLKRLHFGVRQLVNAMQDALVALMRQYGVTANTRQNAPGIYVAGSKLASLGLRVSRGYSLHGLALNVDMDMQPFKRINPCGHPGLRMIQLYDLCPGYDIFQVETDLLDQLCSQLGYSNRLESSGYD